MKTVIAVSLLVVFATTSASAQPTVANQDATAEIHRGKLKIWIGLGLIGAGVLVTPMTAAAGNSAPGYDPVVAGVGLVVLGGAMVLWGVHDQRKAVQPQTTFRVFLGRANGVQVRRFW